MTIMQETSKISQRAKELRMEAVKLNGMSIAQIPVEFRTDEICDVAVNQNGLAIRFVPQTRQHVLAAVRNNAQAIHYALDENVDFEVLMTAACSDRLSCEVLKYMDGSEIVSYMLDAEISRLNAISGVNHKEITRDGLMSQIYSRAVTSDGSNLELVPAIFQTDEVCLSAVYGNDENNPKREVLRFVDDPFLRAALEEYVDGREAEKCRVTDSASIPSM